MLTQGVLVEEYKRTHPESQKLHERAIKVFSANGSAHGLRILEPFSTYVTHVKGSRKWDVDSNKYIDSFIVGMGDNLGFDGKIERTSRLFELIDRYGIISLSIFKPVLLMCYMDSLSIITRKVEV